MYKKTKNEGKTKIFTQNQFSKKLIRNSKKMIIDT